MHLNKNQIQIMLLKRSKKKRDLLRNPMIKSKTTSMDQSLLQISKILISISFALREVLLIIWTTILQAKGLDKVPMLWLDQGYTRKPTRRLLARFTKNLNYWNQTAERESREKSKSWKSWIILISLNSMKLLIHTNRPTL